MVQIMFLALAVPVYMTSKPLNTHEIRPGSPNFIENPGNVRVISTIILLEWSFGKTDIDRNLLL